jgi:hypothetical protein
VCPPIEVPWLPNSTPVDQDDEVCGAKTHYLADGDWKLSQCDVKCLDGYTGVKSEETYGCGTDGQWHPASGTVLTCPAVPCAGDKWYEVDAKAPAGPSTVPSDCLQPKHYEDTCVLTCNDGYTENGYTNTYTCVDDGRKTTGKWQPDKDLICTPMSCDQVANPEGGEVTRPAGEGRSIGSYSWPDLTRAVGVANRE